MPDLTSSRTHVLAFASFDFKNDRAREFATHGFSRRIRTLTHCIENVFNRLPPDDDAIPTTEACIDAAAYVQAFLFNIFGALDNLAWTWVQEKDIKNQDGGQLKETRVGLGKKFRDIRRTFSPLFRGYLDGHQDWFKHLADFRHALAHRIPLYIPRYAIVNHKEYAYLQAQKEAVVGDPQEFDRLTQEQMKHVQFQPVMVHSFSEKSSRIVFHPQILKGLRHSFGIHAIRSGVSLNLVQRWLGHLPARQRDCAGRKLLTDPRCSLGQSASFLNVSLAGGHSPSGPAVISCRRRYHCPSSGALLTGLGTAVGPGSRRLRRRRYADPPAAASSNWPPLRSGSDDFIYSWASRPRTDSTASSHFC